MSVIGSFSKGVYGSVSINFSESGGKNCSNKCKMKGAGCYAETLERVRPVVKRAGMKRRKVGPVQVANQATLELRLRRTPWVRFSVLGSLPMIAEANKAKGFEVAFKNLIKEAKNAGAKIHIPAESPEKTQFYQKWVSKACSETIVRESCQSERRLIESENPNSFVVGKNGESKEKKLQKARKVIEKLRKKGKKVVNCPAIVSNSKCGQCTACSNKKVDTIIYLKH